MIRFIFGLIKGLLLICSVTGAILAWLYVCHKDRIYEEARTTLSTEISRLTDHDVAIGSVAFIPLSTFSFKNIDISEKITGKKLASIETINITPDILSTIRYKRTLLTVELRKISHDNLTGNALFYVGFSKAETYAEVLLPSLIEFISLIDADFKAGPLEIKNINGNLDLDELVISGGKFNFNHNDINYLFTFNTLKSPARGIDTALRSKDMDITGSFIRDGNDLVMNGPRGTAYSIQFDLGGRINGFLLPERGLKIGGKLEADIKDLMFLPKKYCDIIREHKMDGRIRTSFDLAAKKLDPDECIFRSDVDIADLVYDKFHVEGLTAKISFAEKILSLSDVAGRIYNGKFNGELSVDLTDKPSVKNVAANITGLDLALLTGDVSNGKFTLKGLLNTELSLEKDGGVKIAQGDGEQPESSKILGLAQYNGAGNFSIKNSGLDNMDIGNISGKVNLCDGRLSVSKFTGSAYEGRMQADLILGLEEDLLPYHLSYTVKGMDLDKLVTDIAKDKKDKKVDYGYIDMESTTMGYLKDVSTVTGRGNFLIKDANLGNMPILAPIIGDIFCSIQNFFDPGQKMTINSASSDFQILNRKILLDKLIFYGKDFDIESRGSVDFDGNLNFWFQNKFKDPADIKDRKSRNAIRDCIVKFGKYIGRARLKGTVKEPKWDFEFMINNNIPDDQGQSVKSTSQQTS